MCKRLGLQSEQRRATVAKKGLRGFPDYVRDLKTYWQTMVGIDPAYYTFSRHMQT